MTLRLTDQGQSMTERLETNPRMFLSSPVLHYALKPHFKGRHKSREFSVKVELNSRGYRSPEFQRKKGDQFRLLCVGDSFTFGHGVELEQAWPFLVEGGLAEEFQPRPEVINGGYQGCWYPDGYLLYLSREGLLLEPDLVLIGFFMGNDLDHWPLPPRTQDHWRGLDSEGLPTSIYGSVRTWRGYYAKKPSRLSRLPVLRDSRGARMLADFWRKQPVVGSALSPETVPEADIYSVPWSPRVQSKYELLEILFRAMRDRAQRHETRIAVVLIPELRQMDGQGTETEQELAYPQQQMVAMFERLDIPCLDLLSTFREEGGAELYYPVDQHWNPAGHKLAAQYVTEFVRSLRQVTD